MNETSCERASDLIAFLYNEANESETRNFELHLQKCSNCRDEVDSFGRVRESITAWRDEALSGFVSTPVATNRKKSAVAALREFFDLSPLWLKGATGFAVITFCVLVALAIVKVQNPNKHVSSTNIPPNAVYTQQDVNRMVKEALARQEVAKPSVPAPAIIEASKPKRVDRSTQVAKSRRPLSRAEREQLAADLRLLSAPDASLNLIEDRINQ